MMEHGMESVSRQRRLASKALAAGMLHIAQPAWALAPPVNDADRAIRSLADRAAAHIVRHESDAVYALMSPKVKAVYSRDALTRPIAGMQAIWGQIREFRFRTTTQGKRGVGNEWIRTVTHWYHVKTDKHADGTYLRVEVTKEQGRYFIAGYLMERVLFGGQLPFLKQPTGQAPR